VAEQLAQEAYLSVVKQQVAAFANPSIETSLPSQILSRRMLLEVALMAELRENHLLPAVAVVPQFRVQFRQEDREDPNPNPSLLI
jgi:hypothetical protein